MIKKDQGRTDLSVAEIVFPDLVFDFDWYIPTPIIRRLPGMADDELRRRLISLAKDMEDPPEQESERKA